MTRKDYLLGFNMSIFENPKYAEEKKYLSWLTYTSIMAINSTKSNYLYSTNDKNKYYDWLYLDNTTLRDVIDADLPAVNQSHTKVNGFISSYEKACKHFLRTYDRSYSQISSQGNYYTSVELFTNLFSAIFEVTGKNPTPQEVQKAGFIDFRFPFLFSFANENDEQFVQNKYQDENLNEYSAIYEASCKEFLTNLQRFSTSSKTIK